VAGPPDSAQARVALRSPAEIAPRSSSSSSGQQRRAGLLREHRVLEQAELGVEPAHVGEALPVGRVGARVGLGERHHPLVGAAVGEELAGSRAQQVLIL
jgi:hypothetical protein